MTLILVEERSVYNQSVFKYKGSYYESKSGRTYVILGEFNSDSRMWVLRSFNQNRALNCTFTGKQNHEGEITGKCKHRNKTYNFYIKRQK